MRTFTATKVTASRKNLLSFTGEQWIGPFKDELPGIMN
jgi:hypothetical protein